MRGRLVNVLICIALLSVFAADFSVGCGQNQYVYGPVDQKLVSSGGEANYLIKVQGDFYDVPRAFYDRVQVGDVVKYNGREWSIEKPAYVPASVPAPAPPR